MDIKTVHYTFKTPVTVDGETRLATPREDPMEYECPIDLSWDTERKAYAWLEEEAKEVYDIEPEESDGWVLVRITEEVV